MKDRPIISIVTPVHNGAPYLRELIESILSQDYDAVEHIVFDDGSDDEGATAAIIAAYPHLKSWSRENRGQFATINEGLQSASGDIILVINADDVIEDGALSRVAALFAENPDCDLVYGSTIIADAAMQPRSRQTVAVPFIRKKFERDPATFLNFGGISHCALFVSASLLREHALLFSTQYKLAGDTEWMIRLFRAARNIRRLVQPLARYRVLPTSLTRSATVKRIFAEVRQIVAAHGGSFPRYLTRNFFARVRNYLHRIFR